MSQLDTDESVTSTGRSTDSQKSKEKKTMQIYKEPSTNNSHVIVKDLTTIPQEIMEMITSLPDNKAKYDLIKDLGSFEKAMAESLILQMNSNDKRLWLMKLNIRNQNRAKDNLCNARDNAVGLITMASAKINGI